MAPLATVALILASTIACSDALIYGGCRPGFCYGGSVRVARRSPYYGYYRRPVVYGRRLLDAKTSPADDETMTKSGGEEASCMRLGEIVKSDPELALFSKAIARLPAEFKQEFNEAERDVGTHWTVFAPTDVAIQRLRDVVSQGGERNLTDDPEVLIGLVSYLLVPEEYYTEQDLQELDGELIDTVLEGVPLRIEDRDGTTVLQGVGSEANIVDGPLEACDGVLFKIDEVLLPADLDGELEDHQLKVDFPGEAPTPTAEMTVPPDDEKVAAVLEEEASPDV